jgi:hypothetical protein
MSMDVSDIELRHIAAFDDILLNVYSRLNELMTIHVLPAILITELIRIIRVIINTYKNNQNPNIINLRQEINNNNFFEFLLSIIIVYIQKIYFDVDVMWCTNNYYNDPANMNIINILSFKNTCYDFLKKFVEFFLTGLECQTNILSLFFNANTRNYYFTLYGITPFYGGGGGLCMGKCDEEQSKIEYCIDYDKKFSYFIISLFKYISFNKNIYEYNDHNKYIEIINKKKNTYKITKTPKTLKFIVYDDDEFFNEIISKQRRIMSKILGDKINKKN